MVRWCHSTTQTQGCLRHTGRMPLLIWWNSTSCRRSMKSVTPSSMVKYFLPPSSHCREERRTRRMRGRRRTLSLTNRREAHRDHQVVFDLQLMAQRQDEALTVLLALTDQEHAATQTRRHRHGYGWPLYRCRQNTDPSTRPCFSISLWASFLDTPPWNHGWDRWRATREQWREGEHAADLWLLSGLYGTRGLTGRSGTRVEVGHTAPQRFSPLSQEEDPKTTGQNNSFSFMNKKKPPAGSLK